MADNAEIVKGMYDAFARGDIESIVGHFDEKIEWNEAEHIPYWPGGPFIGAQAVLENVFARIPQDFDGFRVDPQRIVAMGDTVLAELRYRAKAKATGLDIDVQVAHVWDFKDGKAVRWQQYADTWLMAHATSFTPTL